MVNIIGALFAVGLIVAGALLITGASLSSASLLSLSWGDMADRTGDRSRTELTLITADIGGAGDDIDISLRNTGQTALAEFSMWDMVIQYYDTPNNQDLQVQWLSHSTSTPPAVGKWAVTGIYLDAGASEAEVYEPNIFNPGEEMIVRLTITQTIPADTDNLVKIGTVNGVTLAAPFSR